MPFLRIDDYDPDWGSHMPVLVKLLNITSGPVLELGMGPCSSPVMHLLCADKERKLVSYESSKKYFDGHQKFKTPLHEVIYVENEKWEDVDIENTYWSVVLVDQTTSKRKDTAIRLAQHADYVILHDSNGRFDSRYRYSEVYPHYKYRYIYHKLSPHTTVVSNFIDVSQLVV
jgi:hypothetical protein